MDDLCLPDPLIRAIWAFVILLFAVGVLEGAVVIWWIIRALRGYRRG